MGRWMFMMCRRRHGSRLGDEYKGGDERSCTGGEWDERGDEEEEQWESEKGEACQCVVL